MPACEAHYNKKKGSCSSCNVCKYCPPLASCESRDSHIGYASTPSTCSATSSRRKRRRGSRASSARGALRINFASESEESPISAPLSTLTNKEKLRRICQILDIDTSVLECPKDGFNETSMNNVARAPDRAKRTISKLMEGISKLVCNSAATYKIQTTKDSNSDVNDGSAFMKNFFTNSSKLIFFCTRRVRVVVESLLASSFFTIV